MAILQRTVQNISVNQPQPIVGQVLVSSQTKNDKFYSSPLLNYVDSVEIDGVFKTQFYTEISTNFNVGDRVFISNGNYDSNEKIKSNKYTRFSDGYRVLAVNKCKVVLDIDFSGKLPFSELSSEDVIIVHNIESQKEFDYVNSLLVPIDYFGNIVLSSPYWGELSGNGLRLNGRNIIFVGESFSGGSDPTTLAYGGVSGPGFYVRNDDGVNNNWENITSEIFQNRIIIENGNNSENRLYIEGKSFEFFGFLFENGFTYKFNKINWSTDTSYKKPYISKSIFRFGNFKGTHNDGIFGSFDRNVVWKNAVWNLGVLLNCEWKSGILNSKTTDVISYNCRLDTTGTFSHPVESLDTNNNRGFGYNFIEDSKFRTYSIVNGNFFNSLFVTESNTKSALDIYYDIQSRFTNVINGGKFEICEINDTRINNAYTLNSYVINTNMNKTKLVSCEVVNSSLVGGYWSGDGGVTVLGADIWGYDIKPGSTIISNPSTFFGTIKLYISEEDFFKLNQGDVFYIPNLNKSSIYDLLSDSGKIVFPLETRFIIDNYDDYDIFYFGPNQVGQLRVSLSSSYENRIKNYVGESDESNGYTANYSFTMNYDVKDFWFPLSGFRGKFDANLNTGGSYNWGDIVEYSGDFYIYLTYDRNDPSRFRASNQSQVAPYLNGDKPTDIEEIPYSDWVLIGNYTSSWSIGNIYTGKFETIGARPRSFQIPVGSVVSDQPNLSSSSKFWVFVGESKSSYTGGGVTTADITVELTKDPITGKTTNSYYKTATNKNYFTKNYFTPNPINLPSINISSTSFGFYKKIGGSFIPTNTNKINPINPNNVDSVFKNIILQNGDFKSGIISESTWLSGDNLNYSNNIITSDPNNNNLNMKVNGNVLSVTLPQNKFATGYNYKGYDLGVGDYVWFKSLSSTGKNNYSAKFKVNRYFEGTGELYLVEALGATVEPDEVTLSQMSTSDVFFLNSQSTKTNNYYSLHKLNITKSTIEKGKFKRTGIDKSTFYNSSFIKYEYPTKNLTNTNLIRLINVLFQQTHNVVKSGLFLKSHFVNDIFEGGIFYDSIWVDGLFKDGLFKNSVWKNGRFMGGKFVDNRFPKITDFDFDSSQDWRLWQGGTFSGGEFYNSVWNKGVFTGGRFYYSDWTGGTWFNGTLGSKNFRAKDTNMGVNKTLQTWGESKTEWYNGLVENAIVGGEGVVDWYGGKMVGGDFTSNGRDPNRYSTWHNGDFFGSSFTKFAWWKNGKFFSGKFLSEIGWTQSNFLTQSTNIRDWSWVDGEFYGGEFGNAGLTANSLWYNGTMEGGIFKGKIWRDGIFTNGKFYGSFNVPDTKSDVNPYIFEFRDEFYGLWLNGNVNPLVSNIKKDRLIKDNDSSVTSKNTRKTLKIVDIYNVVWKSGTFSHELSTFNDSVWLDGEFNKGYFNNSFFNPYVDLNLTGISEDDLKIQKLLNSITSTLNNKYDVTSSSTIYVDTSGVNILFDNDPTYPDISKLTTTLVNDLLNISDDPNYDFDLVGERITDGEAEYFDVNGMALSISKTDLRTNLNSLISTLTVGNSLILKFYSKKLNSIDPDEDAIHFVINCEGVGILTSGMNIISYDIFRLKIYYPKFLSVSQLVPLSYNQSPSCVWKNGIFDGREFNYSEWYDGTFNDGICNGAIWKKGTFNYGKMINCYWENGVWRNGTWDGTPFDTSKLTIISGGFLEISDGSTKQIIDRIISYSNIKKIHLLNVYSLDNTGLTRIHSFDFNNFGVVIETNILSSRSVLSGQKGAPGGGSGPIDSPDWVQSYTLTDELGNFLQIKNYYSSGSLSSYKIRLLSGGNIQVFSDFTNGYKIEISLSAQSFSGVFFDENNNPYVDVEFKIGPKPIVRKKVMVNDEYDKIETFYFFYQPTDFDIRTKETDVWIRRISPGILKLSDSKISTGKFVHSETYNNKLWDFSFGDYNIPSVDINGNFIDPLVGNDNGEINGLRFGNGSFLSGIWKTGVWNNGWRAPWDYGQDGKPIKDDIFYFDSINLSTFKQNENLWYLKIDSNTNTINSDNISSNIFANDYISLSNVVGIDLNEERYLLKDYYRVISVETSGFVITLTIEIPVSKFPLRRFEVDSMSHLIYVTKNIWLGGTFLNGYFRGIWNYGLFKGFPFTTVMDNSHFISGKFDGGRFISKVSEITSSTLIQRSYNTGLVQFFEFFDNNISEMDENPDYIDNTYQSWMDIVYYTTSYVNINSLTSIYDDNFGKLVPLPNLYGYPTLDVLSSYSKFKNSGDIGIDFYRLGTKYSIYTDYLEENGYFRKAFNSEGKPGLQDFTNAGWRIEKGNFYGTPTASFIYNSNITRRNFNKISMILATFGYNVLNNVNIQISDKRYSIVEYDLDYFQRGKDPNTGQFTNTFSKPLNLLGSNYSSINNVFKSGIIKTEYFYNKNALDLILRYNSEYIPPKEKLSMFGYNVTHSIPHIGEESTFSYAGSNPADNVLNYYNTTYSLIFPATSGEFVNSVTVPEKVEEWSSTKIYMKGDIVRRPSTDAFGHYFISLQDNHSGNDLPSLYVYNSGYWARTTVGYNNPNQEFSILEQSEIFDYFTSVRINYFKYLEVDALPFFNYFDFEINFFTTYGLLGNLGLEFLKPHGLKVGDYVTISLDEKKYNPQYEKLARINVINDFPLSNGDIEYSVITDIPYGNTASFLSESGTVRKEGNRIDKRIQSNYYREAPKVDGLDETFIYLGNNQIVVDRDQF